MKTAELRELIIIYISNRVKPPEEETNWFTKILKCPDTKRWE